MWKNASALHPEQKFTESPGLEAWLNASSEPLVCDEEQFRTSFVREAPALCECARTGKRPLRWARWLPVLSANPLSNALNKEFAHEHLLFEVTGSNIGFGTHGLFAENVGQEDYRWDSRCYDGSIMRRAIAETDPPPFYGFIMQNCQTYIERVLRTYAKLRGNP